jgi:hypothetical protein
MDFKLKGLIASDTFTRRTVRHFADLDGNVICKSKCRFGYDCHTEIMLNSLQDFYVEVFRIGTTKTHWKGHLPITSFIECKNCLKRVGVILNSKTSTEI